MPTRPLKLAGFLGVSALIYAAAARPKVLHWGATEEEINNPLPIDDLLPDAEHGSTMAATINAAPSQIWPWLIQMGYDRAGWYSWDLLDHFGRTSANELHPEWQNIAVGDHLKTVPSGETWFEVAAIEPERFLALRAPLDLHGKPFDTSGPRPEKYSDSLWVFQLEKLSDEQTRLVVSTHVDANPKWFTHLTGFVFWEPAHWIMQMRQFSNLKSRVEQGSNS